MTEPDRTIRLDCLRLASASGCTHDKVISTAEEYLKFVNGLKKEIPDKN